jgi:hypothetical protein
MVHAQHQQVETRKTTPWLAIAGVALLAAIFHAPAFVMPLVDIDEATTSILATSIIDGDGLYSDVVDRKPPGLPYLYATVFEVTGTESLVPLRLLMFALEAAAASLIAVAFTRAWRDRLVVVGLFMFGTAALPLVDAHSASAEGFMLLPVTLAWWWSRNDRPLAAGAALAAAVLLKQPAVFVLVPVVYNLCRFPRGKRRSVVALTTFLAIYGGVAVSFGLGDFLFWNVTGNSAYLWSEPILGLVAKGAFAVGLFAVTHLVLLWLAGQALPDWRKDVDLWLWLGAAALGVLAGQRFWGHYFLQLLPPLAALAATQIHRFSAKSVFVVAAVTTLVPVTIFTLVPRDNLPPYERIVREIEANSEPDDAIFVWGTFPEAYWASERPMATRFPHTNFVTGVNQGVPTPGAPEQMCADLERSRPRLVLDMSGTRIRAVERMPMHRSQDMASVMESYSAVAYINGAVLYQLTQAWTGCRAQP